MIRLGIREFISTLYDCGTLDGSVSRNPRWSHWKKFPNTELEEHRIAKDFVNLSGDT